MSNYTQLAKRASLASSLFLFLSSCHSKTDTLGIHFNIEQHKLSNGLRVVLIEDHTVPMVSYQTWFRVGSVDEQPGITGISHLFEHLMFKGTPAFGPKEFFQQLEAKGAEVNAFTTRDYTVYYESFVPTLLPKVIEMEADRMQNLKLDEEVLNSERMVVFEERRMRTDNTAEGKIHEALWGLAYQRHPYHWPVIGYPQDLAAITLPRLISYYKEHYQPANASLVIVGDFKPIDLMKQIHLRYDAIPALPQPKREILAEPEQQEERRLTLYDGVASERFAQAYHVPSAHDEDAYALDVLANILFAGTNSRANRLLVEEKDLAMGVYGSAFTPEYPGLFIITATLKKGVPVAKAEELLEQVIRQAQEKGVTQEEIQVAIKQLTVQLVDSVRTPYGLGVLVGTVQTIFQDPERYADDIQKYLKVTAADVRRVAQKYLIPNNRSVVSLLPTASKQASATAARSEK